LEDPNLKNIGIVIREKQQQFIEIRLIVPTLALV